jgi:hypothetical protein
VLGFENYAAESSILDVPCCLDAAEAATNDNDINLEGRYGSIEGAY